ncbi:MAG: glycosyltransferase [Dehalococcoidales bacterium]|nr:glycosyltransferase [Dehalococcoidales bacterium]
MIYQIIIACLLLVFMVNLILNLRSMRTPSKDAKVPASAPMISILIPARDEEKNIRNCVESLQAQDYPNFEILVLDDNSTDDTASIVKELAVNDKRIRLYSGKMLPDDWAGKPFACYQLAQKASGDWLLFVDADTIHEPHMLRSTLAVAIEEKASLLSGFPRQLATSFSQKVIIPVFYFILLTWIPLWLLHQTKKPKPSMAIGQFFFFAKDEYWRIGGHEAVKDKIVEDVLMGIEVTKHGGRHIAIDLSPVTATNMYDDMGSTWRGLARSIYSLAAITPVGLIAAICLAYYVYIAPFFWLLNGVIIGTEPLLWRGIVVLQILIALLMRWLVDSRFHEPPISMWFHPVGLLFYLLDALYALGRWIVGAGVSWKERFYGKESTIE